MNQKSPNDDEQHKELVNRYEKALEENKTVYLDPYEVVDIATSYVLNNDYKKACKILEYGYQLHPNNILLLLEHAYVYLDLGNIQAAKQTLDNIADHSIIDVILLKGEILLNEGKLNDTEKLFNEIDPKISLSLDVLSNIVEIYLNLGYADFAISWLKKAEGKYAGNTKFLELLADSCFQSHDYAEKAIGYYNELIDIDPYNPEYWCGLAKTYSMLDQNDKALEATEFALASDNEYGKAYWLKGNALNDLENIEEAVEAYKLAMKYKGMDPLKCYAHIGNVYNIGHEYEKAIDALHNALELADELKKDDDILYDIYNNLSMSFCGLKYFEEANEISKISCLSYPNNPFVYIIDARVKAMQGLVEEAKKSCEKAFDIFFAAETYIQAGDIFLEYKYIEIAQEYYEKAMELEPYINKIYHRLAALAVINKDANKYYEYYKKANDNFPIDDIIKFLKEVNTEFNDEFNEFIKQLNDIKNSESNNSSL